VLPLVEVTELEDFATFDAAASEPVRDDDALSPSAPAPQRLEPATLEPATLELEYTPAAVEMVEAVTRGSATHDAAAVERSAAGFTIEAGTVEAAVRSEQRAGATVTALLDEYSAAGTSFAQRGAGSVESVYELDVAGFITPLTSFEHDPVGAMWIAPESNDTPDEGQ
jgi:hypothetical protein